MFLATANDLATFPRPLRDRLEIITIAGYTELEKINIAKDHLLSKQLEEHGLTKSQLQMKADAMKKLSVIIREKQDFPELERQLASICRKAAKIIVGG